MVGLTLIILTLARAQSAAPQFLYSHLAGPLGGWGNVDGIGSAARFESPRGVAVDSAGNVYVADTNNSTIRKITPEGVVTTLAGTSGLRGTTDGIRAAARFLGPESVEVDGAGNLYVGDEPVRKITPGGVVTTISPAFGSLKIAVDSTGNLYGIDYYTIRKMTPDGVVTTLAGSFDSSAVAQYSRDGIGTAAHFSYLTGIGVDSTGTVYVTDSNAIRKITTAGVVTTLAGSAFPSGNVDGTGTTARFNSPKGVDIDEAGNVYVADMGNGTIRKISSTGIVTTLAGTAGQTGSTDGDGAAARFIWPIAVSVDQGGNVYVADAANDNIRKITPLGRVTTLAGLAGHPGSANGTGTAAAFSIFQSGNSFSGVAIDTLGNAYVTDTNNGTIRKITPAGAVTTMAGTAGSQGYSDGTGPEARFSLPQGIALDGANNLYVADTGNHSIRKITPTGTVTTLAGRPVPDQPGTADGIGTSARFHSPTGIVLDRSGTVYVADTGNHTIRKISSGGEVTTIAGQAGRPGGYLDGVGTAASFSFPIGVAVDNAGNVYVADSDNGMIRKISPTATVTTLAGNLGRQGSADGTGTAAQFSSPLGVAVDATGSIYVADSGNNTIRKVTATGAVTTIGGTAGAISSADGIGQAALFNIPTGIAVDGTGNLFIADAGNNAIRKGVPAGPPAITIQPQSQTIAPGNNVQFSVSAAGVPDPTYQWYFNASAFSGATTNTLNFANARSADAGDYTVVVTNQLGSVTSAKATLTISSAPVPPPSTPTPAGGGGAIEGWFVLGVLAIGVASRGGRRGKH